MSSSSSWRTPERPLPSRLRRACLGALLALPGWAAGRALAAAPEPLTGLRRRGSGVFRRFGMVVYEATLWSATDPPRPPLALRLDYRRAIAGPAIVAASLREMRRLTGDDPRLAGWGEALRGIVPDVQPGDHLLGVQDTDGAHFYQAERRLGHIASPAFADAFFAIWLDERTSAPELRADLLGHAR